MGKVSTQTTSEDLDLDGIEGHYGIHGGYTACLRCAPPTVAKPQLQCVSRADGVRLHSTTATTNPGDHRMKSAKNLPYVTGLTRSNIERALAEAGKQTDALQASDLAMLEDFHSLGRLATAALVDLAQISASDRVLDAGGGIGGTARLIAAQRGARVTAVDLTPEYCEVAEWLNDAFGLSDMIEVRAADVTELPFDAGSFDVVVSQHVQMNIADKGRLYAEARRVLAPGGRLAIWDVTAGPGGSLHFPVPWASSPEQSHLVTPERLAELLHEAGFAIAHWDDLTEPAEEVMREFFADEQPALGLHVFVPDFQAKAANLVRSLAEGRARLIQAVLTVPSSPLAPEQPGTDIAYSYPDGEVHHADK